MAIFSNRLASNEGSSFKEVEPNYEGTPSFEKTFNANFQQENDVVAWYNLATKPNFSFDENFSPYDELKAYDSKNKTNYMAMEDTFFKARNRDEFNFIMSKVKEEQDRKAIIAKSGIGANIISGLAAGIISPTVLIPMSAPLKGYKGVAIAVGAAAGASTLAELPLKLDQYTRTNEETTINIAAGTLIGGILGSASVLFRTYFGDLATAEAKMLENKGKTEVVHETHEGSSFSPINEPNLANSTMLEAVDNNVISEAISDLPSNKVMLEATGASNEEISDVISEVLPPKVLNEEGIRPVVDKKAAKVVGTALRYSFADTPVDALVRNSSEFPNDLNVGMQLTDFSRVMVKVDENGNEVKVPQKLSVEDTARVWSKLSLDANDFTTKQFNLYSGKAPKKILETARNSIANKFDGKLTIREFNEQAGIAVRNGGRHEIPEVAEAAKNYIEKVGKPMYEAMHEVGLLKGEVKLADSEHLYRIYNQHAISKNPTRFISTLEDMIYKKLQLEETYNVANGGKVNSVSEMMDELADDSWLYNTVGSSGDDVLRSKAKELSQAFYEKVTGATEGLPQYQIMQTLRNSELGRFMNLPSAPMQDFLINDLEAISSTYTRQMGIDIELAKRFGSVDFGEAVAKGNAEDYAKAQAVLAEKYAGKEMTPALEKERTKAFQALQVKRDQSLAANKVMWERLRGLRGIPADPTALSYRLGNFIKTLNYVTAMGKVVPASFSDMARPLFVHGISRSFGVAFEGITKGARASELSNRAAKQLLAINEAAGHTALVRAGLGEPMLYNSSIEIGLNKIAKGFSAMSGMNHWNGLMRNWEARAAIHESMELFSDVATGSAKAKEAALDRLRAFGLDEKQAKMIWAEANKNGGGDWYKGVLYPNSETWSKEARDLYTASISKLNADTILMPSVNAPAWTDANQFFKLLSQFKSFGYAANQKMLMSGLRENDIKKVNSYLFGIALGAVSYYASASLSGGKVKEEMLSASPTKWLFESVDRSGVIGSLGDIAKVIEQFANPTRAGDNAITNIAGPTFGMATRFNRISSEMVNSLFGEGFNNYDKFKNDVRSTLPYQNLFWLSWAFDLIQGKER